MQEVKKAKDLLDLLMERVSFWIEDKENIKLYKELYIKEINGKKYSFKKLCIESIVDNDFVNNVNLSRIGVDIDPKEFKRLSDYIKMTGDDGVDLSQHIFIGMHGDRLQGVAYASSERHILIRIRKPQLI
ncbi:hypothetical protein [Mucispirillum schaedleri]|uniref:hypothetical protein n=1 Tax=Mucispirillum schaedleri TaxID=248039 RepID=UPI001F563283|nr:hypothetical protein [Mucispirillum schaedleri]